ncbi:beta-galactosidase [Pedobacter sp. PAMC26386]|nr:beta-galactosidase [Pedobacter sp. PAMC26386]
MILKKIYSFSICLLLLLNTTYAQQNKPTRLSPLPLKSETVNTPVISLNGDWNFAIKGEKEKKKIVVPGEWEMQGFKVGDGETAVYSREISIPGNWKDKKVKIRFDGISSHAIVKLNDEVVTEHEGSFVPFEADMTRFIKSGQNILTVEVQALTISDRLACTSQYAAHTVGGILRKALIFVLPDLNIADVTITTFFDKRYQNATLQLNTSIANESEKNAVAVIRYRLKDAAGKIVVEKSLTTKDINPGGNDLLTLSIPVKKPVQWNTEQPYLYQLETALLIGGRVTESVSHQVGFRQIEIKGNRVLVNGSAIKLRGVNRHSVHPLTGRSISADLDRKDALLFRDANCNYIRTSHYPPSEEFLAAADELGLFVENESSLTWIEHDASPIWKLWNYKDEKFLPFMINANIEKMQAGKNHPSVIIWSLGNESRWSPLWAKVLAVVKQLDPSRPTSFHDQCWGGYNNAGSKADIANYHYPGINGAVATDTMSRPVLFGEYAHISDYNRRELVTDPGVRAAYGVPLVKMYDSMYAHNGCLGGAIWSGIDDVFHMPDGRINGYGPWGPIDGWRRPKPEYWGMKKAYSPVVLKNIDKPHINGQQLQLEIENRYDFISLKNVAISCKIDGADVKVSSDIAPHSKGYLTIPINKRTDEIYLTFKDPRGFIINEERINLKDKIEKSVTALYNPSLTENDAAYFVEHSGVVYTISKTTGIITSAKKGNKLVLSQGPVVCVVPMNSEDGGKPNVAGETYQNDIYPLKNYPLYTLFASEIKTQQTDTGLVFSIRTSYINDTKGNIQYLFLKTGIVKVNYEIDYKGKEEKPYQYGMLMELPASYSTLDWKRKGAFTVYSPVDIARSEGHAQLNFRWLPAVEEWGKQPAKDWKDDANQLGSNDFRSTKKEIFNVALTDEQGSGVEALSNGKQASRSWLQDQHIQFLIADYSNNGSEPFYGSPFTENRINIKNKQLKGSVSFRIK